MSIWFMMIGFVMWVIMTILHHIRYMYICVVNNLE